ncbi:MAG TPA: hypothetical protein VLU92_07985 [Candidatus Dormibacteraeota bacterium]|nr:hypothetical protein [Candidatus Dormibacteraeota bacterium]
MERALGAAAAVLTWLGWMTICPALGFPVLGTAAMVNRVLFVEIPEAGHHPDFWLGWTILISGLVGAIGLFIILDRMRLARANIRTGVIYGVALWLLSGLVIMPLIGLTQPLGPEQTGAVAGFQPPDVMRATVMMYSLGPLASVAALIGWVLFGATLGATFSGQTGRRTGSTSSPAR